MKNVFKKVAIATFVTISSTNIIPTINASASEIINKGSSTIVIENDSIEVETKVINEDEIFISTTTNKKEYHEAYVNIKNKTITMDGKPVNIIEERVVEEELKNQSINSTIRNAWAPVYQYTTKYNYSEMVASVGACATVIGGVIALAGSVSIGVSSSIIAKKMSDWATYVGLGTLTGNLFTGYLSCPTYRTQGLVPTGYGGNQYAYRYQNVRSYFSIKNKNGDILVTDCGSWWFGSKPM